MTASIIDPVPGAAEVAAVPILSNESPSLRPFWHPVAMSGEVGPQPLAVTVLGTEYVLARMDGRVTAFEDRCPHRWFPLSAGTVVDGTLECPYHGYRFSADGRCVLIPARGPEASIPTKADLRPAWGVQERYGIIWLAPEEPLADLPVINEWDEPQYGREQIGPSRWKVSAAHATDNFLDVSHFPFVHRGTFGDPADAVVPEYELVRDGLTFRYSYRHLAVNPEEVRLLHGDDSADQERAMTVSYVPPFTVVAEVRYLGTGVVDIVLVSSLAERPGSTRIFSMLIGTDAAKDGEGARIYEEKILLEDKDMLERYPDETFPLDPSAQFHSRADRMTVEFRRILMEIVSRSG
jgi:nitrite reductase/ring-hydroxylating ferredoxin subunit